VGIRIDTTEIKMKSKGDSEAGTGVKLPKPWIQATVNTDQVV
jgi:hypothetical protein